MREKTFQERRFQPGACTCGHYNWQHLRQNNPDGLRLDHSRSHRRCSPSRTARAAVALSWQVQSASSALSIVTICDTFTTLALERLASPFFRSTLPCAVSPRRVFFFLDERHS